MSIHIPQSARETVPALPFQFERHRRQWRQLDQDRMLAPHPLSLLALDAAVIPDIPAAVSFGVGVDNFAVKSSLRYAETIVGSHQRRRIDNENDDLVFARFPQERNDAVVGVVKIDPLKAFEAVVLLPERGLAFLSEIQMLNHPSQPIVSRKIDKLPVEARVVVPFMPLAELAPHEKQLLAGMAIHPRVKHSKIGKFLPFVARHLRQERALAVHDFIVTEHENEMFLKRVKQRKRDVAVMKTPINRIERHVFQEIVHPAHVPFESKTESAEISRP